MGRVSWRRRDASHDATGPDGRHVRDWHADARPERPAGPDGRPAPAPERDRHLAGLDPAQRVEREEHVGHALRFKPGPGGSIYEVT